MTDDDLVLVPEVFPFATLDDGVRRDAPADRDPEVDESEPDDQPEEKSLQEIAAEADGWQDVGALLKKTGGDR